VRPGAGSREATGTERATALANALLDRYGVLTREAVHAEGVAGGFSSVYAVLKAMEDQGKVRRGYFVAGLGATQFARPGAEGRLRALRDGSPEAEPIVLAATDPANPYGAALQWPDAPASESADAPRPQRAAGALVVLADGRAIGYLSRTERSLLTFLPPDEPERSQAARALAGALADLVDSGRRRVVLVASVDGMDPGASALARALSESGFTSGSRGWIRRPISRAGTG
jgi:ATP-dependent Lhr-like helicase